jgi:hypothetical protein
MASPSVKGNVATTPAEATAFPFAEYEAHYIISLRGIDAGEAIHTLRKRQDGQYHFEARTEPRIALLPYHYVESSDFTWESGKFLPHNYYYNIHEGKKRKKGHVLFDWKEHKIHNRELKVPWEQSIEQGVQDKITQGLSLRQAMKTGQHTLKYVVAESDKLKNYTFTIKGKERLKTKLGMLDTVKLEHVSRKGHRTTLWLADKYDFLPVKMSQSREGKVVSTGEISSFALTKS